MKRRILAMLCVLALMLGMLSSLAYADDTAAAATNGTQSYTSLQAAVDAFDSGVITLEADAQDVTVAKDVYLDLNGNDITGSVTVTGGTLYCMDSKTDDYTVADDAYGKLTGTVTGNVAGIPVEADCAQDGYLMVSGDEGISFHRVTLQIYAMSLRAGNVGVYYKSHFVGDEVVAENVQTFGVALSVKGEPTAENLETQCGYSWFTDFKAGEGSNSASATGTLLHGIMKTANTDEVNTRNAGLPVYGRPYIKTADGLMFGAVVSRSLQSQVEAVDAVWDSLLSAQKATVLDMYAGFTGTMDAWNIPNIKGAEDPGTDPDDSVITLPIPVTAENGVVTEAVTVSEGGVSVTVPAGVQLAEGVTELTLTVTPKETSDSGLTLEESQVLIPMDVHVEGISAENTVPLTIYLGKILPENLNLGNYTIYHVENGMANEMTLIAADEEFTAHNQYKYTLDGEVTLYMATFSEVAAVANEENIWNGNIETEWYNTTDTSFEIRNADQLAGLNQLVSAENSFSGKTVTLLSDINFGGSENSDNVWYPIGYWAAGEGENAAGETEWYTYGGPFSGTFDGNGNTVTGIYQNTWIMDGNYDNGYWDEAMGLFGYVLNGTVKNLTVDSFSSDGEFTPTGVVTAYAANATFENIAITNCNPRVYNTGNGGIIGIGGLSDDTEEKLLTLKNITVDNTNKISALWGSWDVACGGLMGMFRGAGKVVLEDCHVSAVMDVYNDVCANYQYYWYRYAGMIIGSVRTNTTDANGYTIPDLSGITATGCTVTYGDWNQYWYCELVDNSIASYTHDYQFSRLTEIDSLSDISDDNGMTWKQAGNYVLVAEDGTATCYHIKTAEDGTLYKHEHADSGVDVGYDVDNDGEDDLKENRQRYLMSFSQLFNGYGYGVKAVYKADEYAQYQDQLGIEIDEGGTVTAEPKFEQNADFSRNIETNTELKASDIFEVIDGVTPGSPVYVFVSPVDEGENKSTVAALGLNGPSLADISLTFTGLGKAKITVTDYWYCTPTVIEVNVTEPADVDKFTSVGSKEVVAGEEVLLGSLFTAVADVTIDSANVEVTVSGGGHTYTANDSDWTQSALAFTQENATYTVTVTDNNNCNPATVTVTTTANDSFGIKFENTEKYLYRVGNMNTVALGSLFEELSTATINSAVTVTVTSILDETKTGFYTFTENATWTSATLKFADDFTGPVVVTIDAVGANAVTLNLEVVTAKNTTTAASATANNVVLLNDISGTFSVTNGYTFYGNGFTVTLPTSSVQNVGNGFTGYISIGASQDDGIANGGNLDNVRIEGPVYPEMYIYRDQAKITDTSDADYGDGYNMRYFKNSVIVYGGNCTISNSYISGSRTALCLRGGNNVVIENTTLSGGAYANMQICAGSSVTLRDVTTVQTDVTDSYGKGKTAHGLGIAVDSSVVDIYIEGELNQYNWLCEEQWNTLVPSDYQSSFPDFFGNSKYSKYWHYLNGGTDPYVNLTFIFACNWDTSKIHDNHTAADYETCDSTIAGVAGGVYSKVNTVGGNAITDANLADPGYTSPGFNPVAPVFSFDNTANNDADDEADAADTYCVYDEASGVLKIGTTTGSKTLDLSGVAVTKDGTSLDYTAYLNGTAFNGTTVTINAADGAKQTLSFKATSDNAGYDKDGNPVEGTIEYTWTVTVEVATLAYPAPVWNMGGDYTFDTSNCYYAYYSTSQGYGEAVPIYEGIKINYYNQSGTLVELDLSGTTTLPTGSDNANANAFTYTLADGSVLTMKYSSGWKSGATTHQFTAYNSKAYVYPQSLDNDNYVRAKTTNQDFNVKISYTFTDPNGQSTETVTMSWYNAAASNGSVSTVQWKTFDSTNGKNSSICVTPDTLVTMADGSKKEIQCVSVGEEVLAWNFHTGAYEIVPLSLAQIDGSGEMNVLHLYFEDGTELKVLGEHGIFDADLNTFIFIDEYDVESYLGHSFVKQDGDSYKTVKLVDYEVTTETTDAYTILSVEHYNVLLEDMLTVTPAHVGGNFFNPFEIGEDMKYDAESVQADIEKYGLYTYEDFAHVLTYEQFVALNIPQFKVSVGKGLVTYEGLIYLIENFINR